MHSFNFSRLVFLAMMLLCGMSLSAQTINGRVWNDSNNNGLQDAGELGLGSVWVQIRNSVTNTTPSGAQGFTQPNGTYSFNVPAGSYKVKIANPGSGYNGSTPNVGSNDNIDSDVDIYGSSSVFSVGAGQTVSIDGGFTNGSSGGSGGGTGSTCLMPVFVATSNIVCNGSTFSFTMLSSCNNTTAVGGWDYVAGGLSNQPYGVPKVVGPFPCGTLASVTVKDHSNAACSTTVTVSSPACCSNGGGGGTPTTPTVSISDVTVNEGAGTASLTVSLSAVSTTPTTVTVVTSNGSAISGSDYAPVTMTVTIPAGSLSAVVMFPIINDNIAEPTETFNATLSNPSGATIADGSGTVTIIDNDNTTPNPTDPCAGISIAPGANNTILVNGMTAQYSKIKVLNNAFATVFSQTYTSAPGTVTVPTLPAGTYSVKVTVMQANFSVVCTKELSITTGGTPTPTTPTVSISDITVNENAGTASLIVSLSAPKSTPTTVVVSTSNGTATAGSDYTAVNTTVTIPAGATSAVVTFPIIDNSINEPTENFIATLSNPNGATIADGSGTVTILDNDSVTPTPTTPTVSISDVTVNEGAGNASLTVSLSAVSTTPTTVTVVTSNGTAISGSDYAPVTMTVTIPAGSLSAVVMFPIINDNTAEPTETFNATLSNPSGATIADGSGTVTILDNDNTTPNPTDPCAGISIAPGANNTIVVNGMTAQYSKIKVLNNVFSTVFSQTYTSAPGTVTVPTLPAGTYSVKVTVMQANFSVVCTKEVSITTGGTPTPTTPTVSISDVTVNENAGTASLTVSLSAPSTTPTTVTVVTSNGTATSGSDYTPVTMTVTIPAGSISANVTFPIVDDTTNEPTESFTATLSNPSGANIADGSGTVTILDNDAITPTPTTPTVSISDVTVNENAGTASLVVSLSAPSTTPTTVTVVTSNGTATSGSDYTPVTMTVTIPAGSISANVTFPIVDDTTNEPTETFTATLSNPSGATIADGSGTVTINDNDNTTGPINCDNISIAVNNGNIVVTGVNAPLSFVQVFNSSWGQVFNQSYTTAPGTVNVPSLPAGTYYVKVDFLTAQWQAICKKEAYITIGGGTTPTTPSLSISDVTVNENAGTASLTVTLSAPSNTPTTVTLTTNNGTAVNGSDYSPLTTTVTIPAGATVATVTLPILDDTTGEPTEVFFANLSNPTGATIADAQGTVTILDNDGGSTTAPVANPDNASTPMNTPVNISPLINDNLNGGTLQMVMLVSSPANGTAVLNGTNFVYTPNAGYTGTDVFTYKVVSSNGTSNTTTVTTTVGGQMVTPSLTINDVTVNENTGTSTVRVSLSQASTSPVVFTLATSDGSAATGSDYVAVNNSYTIPAGSTFLDIVVPIVNNTLAEPTESLNTTITSATGANIADGAGTITILDDDQPGALPVVSVGSISVNENAGTATVNVTIPTPSNTPVTVVVTTTNGTATSGSDYTTTSTTVTIPAGSTSASFTVPILEDAIDELDEVLNVVLSSPSNATLGTATGTITILDNDLPSPAVLNLTQPADITLTLTTSATSGIVNYPLPVANTTCPGGFTNLIRTSGPASGSAFPVGTTQVCYAATDNCRSTW